MRNPWGHRPEDPPEGEDPHHPINGDPPGQPWYRWRGGDAMFPGSLIGLVVFLIVLVILLRILGLF